MKLFYIALFTSLFSIVTAHASLSHHSRAVNYSDGLSNVYVKAIYQDSAGFMWFGTKNRLNRFDGVSMRTFDCYDKVNNKRNNNINSILEIAKNTLWIGTDDGIFIFDVEKESFHFFNKETIHKEQIDQWTAGIYKDKNHNIWVIVPNQGVFRYNIDKDVLKLYKVVEDFQLGTNHPECMTVDETGKVWIGSNGSGIYLYNEEQDSFKQYLGNHGNESLKEKNIYTIHHHNDKIIIGVHEENLMLLDPSTNTVRTIDIVAINQSIIRHIVVYDSKLWVATQNGLYSMLWNNGDIDKTSLITYTLSDKYIMYTYRDREGGMWVGTRYGGINLLPNHGDFFEIYAPKNQNLPNVSNRIKELEEDDEGNIWIGTEDSGVLKFDPKQRLFEIIQTPTGNKQPLSFLKRNENIWIGYFKGGLDILSTKSKRIQHFKMIDYGINEESLFVLYEDKSGNVWMANGWEIYTLKKGEKKFTKMDMFGLSYTHDIFQDSEGYIWLAALGTGLSRYNPKDLSVRQFRVDTGEGLPTNMINGISEDHKGRLWFSTDRGGICVYDKKTDKFKTYSIEQGLPDDMTYKVLEDQNHHLWFGTNTGLVHFNPETEEIKTYTEKDGLPSNTFNLNSVLKSKSGKLYMGTMEGLIAFEPHAFTRNNFVPSIQITQFFVAGEAITPKASSPVEIEKSIQLLDKITLSYKHSNISIAFASLSYTSPQSNTYAYKLDGVDQSWIYTKENKTASYANMNSGKYIFRVKGTNNDGVWSNDERTLEIEILPPWWKTGIAYIIYVLVIILLSYFTITYSIRKYNRRNIIKQRLFEVKKEKELYEAKLNFFTDIAHEIRTPVTLISGPLESIITEDISNEKVNKGLSIIKKNTNTLLSLINQLLDFRKVDSERFIVNITQLEILELIESIISRFEGSIKAKGITYSVNKNGHSSIYIEADKEAVEKIINNLLSNAIKYGKTYIHISVEEENSFLKLQVTNDGDTIPDEFRNKLFEPFFRVRNSLNQEGSGLGLSLTKSLVEILNGYIYYDSAEGVNNFNLKLPKTDTIEKTEKEYNIVEPIKPTTEEDSSSLLVQSLLDITEQKRSLLLVEDNPDMLDFLRGELTPFFDIESATNGEEAICLLKEKHFSTVISDIMMPVMNGLELCKYIKESENHKHLIVILLTAKNDTDSKIHALNIGADAYVEKPFSIKYIISLIESLERNRQTVISNYTHNPYFAMEQTSLNSHDRIFVEKVVDSINSNISDQNFNVEKLAEMLNYSRSSLHRRMKATIDLAPIDLIRMIRLQKAVELIKLGEHRISDIAYLVGISSPSYFVRLFQSQYSMTPTEYRDSLFEK